MRSAVAYAVPIKLFLLAMQIIKVRPYCPCKHKLAQLFVVVRVLSRVFYARHSGIVHAGLAFAGTLVIAVKLVGATVFARSVIIYHALLLVDTLSVFDVLASRIWQVTYLVLARGAFTCAVKLGARFSDIPCFA